ncbi:MAG: TRAP transporter large permease, partial [bacterium]
GAILPPSVPLVIIGSQLGISIGGLFVAGIIPGILTGIALMITAWIISRRRGYGEIKPFAGFRQAGRDTLSASPVLLIPLIIVGGMLGGVFTPTEAGAIAVLYAAAVGSLYYRALDRAALWASFLTTARVSASALLIVAVSLVFGRILAYQQVPQQLLEIVLAITDNKILLFLILVAFFLFVGTFMDAVANMIILGPLLMPLAIDGLGMHPFQYGMFLMYALLLGVLTPPLGLVLFIVGPIAKVSMEAVSYAVLPFLFAMLIVLTMIAFIPGVTTLLPFWSGYN